MCEEMDKLAYLDVEIGRIKGLMKELREEIKAEVQISGRDDFKKEYMEFMKGTLYQRMVNLIRRYETLEECRLSNVLMSASDEEYDCDCGCDDMSESLVALDKATDKVKSVLSDVVALTDVVVAKNVEVKEVKVKDEKVDEPKK